MIKLLRKLFTNREIENGVPYLRANKHSLRTINTEQITLEEYVQKFTGELGWQNSCSECNKEQYLHNYGYAQFCKEHAPTMIMNCSPEEYEKKYGISVDQIKSENANINIEFNK